MFSGSIFKKCIENMDKQYKSCGKYKIIDVDNNSELIKMNKFLVKKFLERHEKIGNFWDRHIVSEEIHTDCFGKEKTFALETLYNDNSENEKELIDYEENKLIDCDLDEMYLTLVDESCWFLNRYGFDVEFPKNFNDEQESLIEIHYANSATKPVNTDLAIHCDNDRYEYGDLHTLIIYLDIDCIGGELDIYNWFETKVINSITPKCEDKNKTRCVLLAGNCCHRPKPVLSGKRIAVSYQFRRDPNIDPDRDEDDYEYEDN